MCRASFLGDHVLRPSSSIDAVGPETAVELYVVGTQVKRSAGLLREECFGFVGGPKKDNYYLVIWGVYYLGARVTYICHCSACCVIYVLRPTCMPRVTGFPSDFYYKKPQNDGPSKSRAFLIQVRSDS